MMRINVFAIGILLMIFLVNGCVTVNVGSSPLNDTSVTNNGVNDPRITPTSVNTPIPTVITTITPTTSPRFTSRLNFANSSSSNDVYIVSSQSSNKQVKEGLTADGKVYETFTLQVSNNGNQTAKNVRLILNIIDEYNLNNIYCQEFSVGDILKGETKGITLNTEPHEMLEYKLLTFDAQWGDIGEFYNLDVFQITMSRG